MHKFVIILAVCLVAAQAFVKRDAPEAPKSDDVLKQIKDVATNIGHQIEETFSPDNIKKGIQDFQNQVKSLLEPKENAPKA